MDSYEAARLISAVAGGAQIGSFLLLSLLNRPLLAQWPDDLQYLWIFKRFYRLNTALSVLAGVFAVLGQAREAGVLFAILGVSFVLAHLHLLRALSQLEQNYSKSYSTKFKRSPKQLRTILKFTQQFMHLLQIFALIYLIGRLI